MWPGIAFLPTTTSDRTSPWQDHPPPGVSSAVLSPRTWPRAGDRSLIASDVGRVHGKGRSSAVSDVVSAGNEACHPGPPARAGFIPSLC